MTTRACPSCGAVFAQADGPMHAYLGASPECWAQFNVSMALHYSDLAYWPAHQLLTDAYCVQHSAGDDRRAVQSAAIHLAAVVFQFEEPDAGDDAIVRLRKALAARSDFPRFEPCPPPTATIDAVATGDGPETHRETVRAYARQVYEDWRDHHAAARRLIEEALA